jgi:hypothetical protein
MQSAHCHFLCIACAHDILILNPPTLSNLCFIAGKSFNTVNTALKEYVFFLILSPK